MVLAFAAGSGCGPDLEQICEDFRECLGGNDQDVEACVRTQEMLAEAADMQDCSDEHLQWLECDYQASICQETPLGISCAMDSQCPAGESEIVRCISNECVRKDYGPKDPSTCEQELDACASCTTWETCDGVTFSDES